jgi:hypothetical protein
MKLSAGLPYLVRLSKIGSGMKNFSAPHKGFPQSAVLRILNEDSSSDRVRDASDSYAQLVNLLSLKFQPI